MRDLHLDFETYSEADLKKVGLWAYSMHPSTEVLMMAWAFDDDEPQLWLPRERAPKWTDHIIINEWGAQVVAWNDFFELCIMKNVLKWPHIPEPKYWRDTAAQAAVLALPRSLGGCGEALGLPTEEAKDKEGKSLITLFCKPRKSTKKGKQVLTRTYPEDQPEKFEKFKHYCIQDVIAERAIDKLLRPLSPDSRKTWELDRKINLRGVQFDTKSVDDAMAIREEARGKLLGEVSLITGGKLANINSVPQFRACIEETYGIPLENAQAEYLKEALKGLEKEPESNPIGLELIRLRLKLAKSSLAKYDKISQIADADGIARGLLRFHGASTGRWSGNLFQPQNLPRPSFDDTDECISLFKHRDSRIIEALYDDTLEALSSCIRGMVTASEGCRLIVSDFSQIESRMLKWLAGDEKGLDAYRSGMDIYKVNAAAAFKVPYESVTKDQRVIGKVIELACGYQGAVGAFQQFADVYGVRIPDPEAKALVGAWRVGNPKIVSYWYNVEETAVKAVAHPGTVQTIRNIQFKVIGSGRLKFLYCKLPSGRAIAYHRPSLVESKFNKMQIKYWGVDSKTKKYCEQRTYGGRLVENITQACACDRMTYSMFGAEFEGYPIKLTVHDELVTDVPNGRGSLKGLNDLMSVNPKWAQGLPVVAEGYESRRYRK